MSHFSRLFCAITFLLAAAMLRAEDPFSFNRTPGKLPKEIVPARYTIDLTPDLDHAVFSGEEAIEIEVIRPVREIVLNSLGLEISQAVLMPGNVEIPKRETDSAAQTLTLTLPEELPPGRHTLRLTFSGKLTEAPQGLYITRFQKDGKDLRALATQFEGTDARRMFPCWDEPVFRAAFALTVTLPKRFQAVSNMPASAPEAMAGELVKHRFAETPKMSSYLLALCAGDLEKIEDEIDGVRLGIYVTPGKRERARFAMEATKKVLGYYHEYFGIKYPLPKLDQVAFPSTGASGMENWGCIVYNDNALLYDPVESSQQTKERVFAVVAHEIAHQWFGDLVTMAWWDNLWLNEGFASWMGTKATDRFNPDWKVWLRAAGEKEWAMRLDARATTHPIQRPVASESQIDDAFDEITYSKGQAVLRMIENWLGEEPFRDGIRHYLQAHAYSSSTTADLWQSLEDVSGKSVREFAAGWTEQPGFPVVTIEEHPAQATSVLLRQQRFTIHQRDPAPLQWQIPVGIGRAGDPLHAEVVLLRRDANATVPIEADAAIKANLGDKGYYRAQYSPAFFKLLRKAVPHLAEADRLNVLNDTWAFVEAGRAPAADYLNLADSVADQATATELGQIVNVIQGIDGMERGQANREGFRKWAIAFLRPHLARLGWEKKPAESPLDTSLRASLMRLLGWFGDEATLREVRGRFANYLADPSSLDGDLRSPILGVIGHEADEPTWEKLHSLAKSADSFEQKRILYSALSGARDPALAQKTLALSLTDELIAPDAARLVGRVAHEGEHPEAGWKFARENLEALLAKLPALGVNDYVPGVFRAFTEPSRADELESFAAQNLPPSVQPSVAKAADEIRFRAEFKARALPEIDAWWGARAAANSP